MENLNQKTIKPIIAEIVGIENNDQWDIYDFDPAEGLYLIHYNMNTNMDKYGHIRGVVVDICGKKIVCASYGNTKSVITDKLENTDAQDVIDSNGNTYKLDVNKYMYKKSVEGVIIRIFVFNGKIYYSTNRKLNIMNTTSRWGPRTHFRDMLKQFGVPSIKDLYGDDIEYSPWVIILMITHKDVLHATKEDIGNGYISLLNIIKLWDTLEGVDDDKICYTKPEIKNVSDDIELVKKGGMYYTPAILTLEEANKHLYNGYSDLEIEDERLRNGESIVAIPKENNDKWPFHSIKVQSKSYTWRLSLRGDGLNPYMHFYVLTDLAKMDTSNPIDLQTYKDKFPLLNIYKVKSVIQYIKDNGYIDCWDQDKTSNSSIMLEEDRVYNIWACYLMSMPLTMQPLVVEMYTKYLDDKKFLTNYIYKVYNSNMHSGNKTIDTLIINIVELVRQNKNKLNIISMDELVKNIIHNQLSKKRGRQLYKMVKYSKRT